MNLKKLLVKQKKNIKKYKIMNNETKKNNVLY